MCSYHTLYIILLFSYLFLLYEAFLSSLLFRIKSNGHAFFLQDVVFIIKIFYNVFS